MKQIQQLLSLGIIVLMLTACQGSGGGKDGNKGDTTQNNISENVDCATIGNFAIDETTAKRLMTNFSSDFRYEGKPTEVKGLSKSFWIDSVIIVELSKFLEANKEYDGARVYFGSVNSQSTIILVPTKGDSKKHADQYGQLFTLPAGTVTEFTNHNIEEKAFTSQRTEFDSVFRKEYAGCKPDSIIDSLSKGVWFSSCVFAKMSNYFQNTTLKIDGIRVHAAAYDSRVLQGDNQKYDHQSTVVFVATNPGAHGEEKHKDNWALLQVFFQQEFRMMAAYNHGDLCPNNCN